MDELKTPRPAEKDESLMEREVNDPAPKAEQMPDNGAAKEAEAVSATGAAEPNANTRAADRAVALDAAVRKRQEEMKRAEHRTLRAAGGLARAAGATSFDSDTFFGMLLSTVAEIKSNPDAAEKYRAIGMEARIERSGANKDEVVVRPAPVEADKIRALNELGLTRNAKRNSCEGRAKIDEVARLVANWPGTRVYYFVDFEEQLYVPPRPAQVVGTDAHDGGAAPSSPSMTYPSGIQRLRRPMSPVKKDPEET